MSHVLSDRWLQQHSWFRDNGQREDVANVIRFRLADDRSEDECRHLLRFVWHLRVGYEEVAYRELVSHVSSAKMAVLDRLFTLVAAKDFVGIDNWVKSCEVELKPVEDRTFYRDRHDMRLEAFVPRLASDLSLVTTMTEEGADAVLGYLLSMACEAQNVANIELGREAIARIPARWLTPRLPAVAEEHLDLTDPWECRRLLELYSMLDRDLLAHFATQCLNSRNEEIAETGRDFLADD